MIFAIKSWKAKNLSCGSDVWKYHVHLLMFSPGSGLSVTSPGVLNMCFCHARPRDREHVISSRSFLTWGEQVPMMFSAQNNSSSCMFSFTTFFFLWKFRKILQQFLYPIAFYTEWEKNSKLKREGRSIGDVLQPYFFPSLFFLCTFTKILYHFFFYPISFCAGINTKTVEKNARNWKGKVWNVLLLFFLWTFTQILYHFFLSHCFLFRD